MSPGRAEKESEKPEMVSNVKILGVLKGEYSKILTSDAQLFLVLLHRCFEPRRRELLNKRVQRQHEFDAFAVPDFLVETEYIRNDPNWRCAGLSPGLINRRVEITGPVDRKMVINALNSDATQYMADFEDSTSPTWTNIMDGQVNLYDAVRRRISFDAPNGKQYRLRQDHGDLPTILVRPRGWHLVEAHFLIDDSPISASLFDFGLYFFHNANAALSIGHGPYFYLPKLESHLEARLWNDVFNTSQDQLGIPRGTIRSTVLIETILAAFEMDEILYELRDHSAGLNCGRWDYIFSFIKKFRNRKEFVLPDRKYVTMTVPFMKSYVDLLIQTCHRRGVHAMGGMAAQIPIKSDPAANELAMAKVRSDKEREVLAGHDGTWVAHPDLIPIAKEVFNKHMPQSNQIFNQREDVFVSGRDLVNPKMDGVITLQGVTDNIIVAYKYTSAWLKGNGCVPINYLMEDAATAEISRSQLWQWVHHQCITDDSKDTITIESIKQLMNKVLPEPIDRRAHQIIYDLVSAKELPEFLASICYDDIISINNPSKI